MNDLIECKKCGTLCQVDGEFPKFFAYCDTCDDYADYDMEEWTADYMAMIADGRPEKGEV